MRPVAHVLRLVACTAVLFPALEGAATAAQTSDFFAEPQLRSPLPLEAAPPPQLAQADGRQAEADRLYRQGGEQFNASQYQAALESWQAALELYRAMGHRQKEGNTLNALGLLFSIAGQVPTAIDYHEQALAIAREMGDSWGEGNALGNLGVAYFRLDQYQEARALFEQRLIIAREIDDLLGEGSALDNLGSIYVQLSQYQEAISLFEQSIAITRKMGDRRREGIALGNLGVAYANLGQYQEAITLFEQSIAITREMGDRRGEGIDLNNLGLVYNNLGQYQEAIALFEQRLIIVREIGDRRGEGTTLDSLGVAYSNLGQYQEAIALFEQALVIARETGNRRGEGSILGNWGSVYSSLDQYQEAITRHKQSLVISRETGDRLSEGIALGNLGNAYDNLGQYQEALEQYRQALALFGELGNRLEEGIALSNIGKLLNRQNQPELAIVFLKASVEVREAIRGDIRGLDTSLQQSFTDTVANDYRFLADLLLQQDRIIEAQRVLDLLKVQELDDYLRDVQRNAQTETGVVYLRPEEAILARYDNLQSSAIAAGQELNDLKAIPQAQRNDQQNQRIAQLTDLLDAINGDFRDFARSPEIRQLIDQLSFEAQDASLSLNQLDRLRDELRQLNAAIFYPLILEDRLELVITVPDSPPLRRTVDISRDNLNAAILAFRTALTNPGADAQPPAQQLYDWLIRPLEADLAAAGIDTIIYSPDGQLRYIPLAALHNGDQWLIQQYRINNITAESLTDLTQRDTSQPRILAAAYTNPSLIHEPDVNGTRYTFQGLPGAGDEVALLPTDTKFLDEAFSLAAVRPLMDEYSILHFATHAAFVPGVPEDSFILFGNGETPTLRDVEDWSLNGVDLVVLSACETGVGGLGNGEEILGLGYQFQVSGARAVMSSLWKVSDRGTQILMTEFYAALAQGMTKAAALQAAQVALITQAGTAAGELRGDGTIAIISTETGEPITDSDLSHPYYWAPFILIGNGL